MLSIEIPVLLILGHWIDLRCFSLNHNCHMLILMVILSSRISLTTQIGWIPFSYLVRWCWTRRRLETDPRYTNFFLFILTLSPRSSQITRGTFFWYYFSIYNASTSSQSADKRLVSRCPQCFTFLYRIILTPYEWSHNLWLLSGLWKHRLWIALRENFLDLYNRTGFFLVLHFEEVRALLMPWWIFWSLADKAYKLVWRWSNDSWR